jgi:hypothetical protein
MTQKVLSLMRCVAGIKKIINNGKKYGLRIAIRLEAKEDFFEGKGD